MKNILQVKLLYLYTRRNFDPELRGLQLLLLNIDSYILYSQFKNTYRYKKYEPDMKLFH